MANSLRFAFCAHQLKMMRAPVCVCIFISFLLEMAATLEKKRKKIEILSAANNITHLCLSLSVCVSFSGRRRRLSFPDAC